VSYLVLLYKIKYNFHTILYDAMTWNITTTPTFLNELLNLPRHVTRKLPRKISDIQADPHSVRLDAIRLKNNREVSRVHVGDDYRLFYTFGNGWIKLLSICHRRDCYRRRIPEPTLPDIKTDEDSLEPKTLSNDNKLITEGKLRDWNIPERYWENLLIIKNEDELLSLDIPSNYIFLLIDNLSPRSLDEIEYQNELLVSPEDLESFVEGKLEITKFLLKLSQEQQRLKDLQTNNAILVKGAAGTGKSTLALYRVKKLVDSGVEKILFTTYTESLANYSKYLLKDLLGKSPEQCGVEVSTFDWTAIKYYKQQYGNPLFPEDNGLIFLEYAIKSIPVSQQILLNNLKIEYLLEEIQIIIEARNINDLSSYLQENRYGRKLPLKNRQREAIWEVYKFWKQIMQDSGYISKGLMRQKALEIVQQKQEKPYNAVIIDEAQDLSPVALRLLAEIVVSPSGLYLTADISQSLYQRGFSWNYIQDAIKFKGEVKILRNSYRSTSQITKACTEIFNYLGLLASDGETLSTKPIDLIGDKPTILLINDPIQQIKKNKDFFITSSKTYRLPVYGGAVLTSDPEIGKIIAQQLNVHGLKAAFMEKDEIDISKHCIKIMTINSSKGFEFPFVTLVGLEEGKLPNLTNIPSEEEDEALKQQLRLFYVGCSRAMRSLLVCASKTSPSRFISQFNKSSYWSFEEA
jgi:mRNA-degrading endonuclease RelE of RelBE toxin-antitoxin system